MSITDELLAWSGWRFVPGMRYWCGATHDDAAAVWVSERPDHIAALNHATTRDCYPDLSNRGTTGLIEGVLLREAWGPAAIIVTRRPTDDCGAICICDRQGSVLFVSDVGYWPVTLVRACLAAPTRGES